MALGNTSTTNNRQGLTAQSTLTNNQEFLTSTGGVLNINANIGSGLVPGKFDALTYTNTSTTVDTYKYYTGGIAGTLVATLTVTWTDNTKSVLVSAVRT